MLALLVTLASAAWQRRTGPSYPVRGTATLGGERIEYRLSRSHVTGSDLPVRVAVGGTEASGEVLWRHFRSPEPFAELPMRQEGGELVAALPSQPPAGKLEYRVRLRAGAGEVLVPLEPAVMRFRGAVPGAVLVPHIAAMFLGMLFSNAAGLSAALARPQAARQGRMALALLAVGGLLLGPIVQKHAFGAYWTGFPFGYDLTDNKTALAVLAWAAAAWAASRGRGARAAIVAASLVTLLVFAIPHSLFGSELRREPPSSGPAG
jgi:hypothetical protein